MSYQPLVVDAKTPPGIQKFIRQHLDRQFNDIHCMLRLPLFDLVADCALAASNSLLNLVSGISSLLTTDFDTTGRSQLLFKCILLNYYPWDVQSPQGGTKERAMDDLYRYFRNPLVHSLGIKTKGNFLVEVTKKGLSEVETERLERSQSSLGPAIIYEPYQLNKENIEKITLDVANFYWGVREMLRRLTCNNNQIQNIEQNLGIQGWV